jgi:hypothetical protein
MAHFFACVELMNQFTTAVFTLTTRASARIAKNKLANVPAARRGDVLPHRRLDLAAAEYSGLFRAGLARSHAVKVQGAFIPCEEACSSRSKASVTTA